MSLKCYAQTNGATFETTWDSQCGYSNASTHVNCCFDGDFCMSDNICHYTHSQIDGSGYYISGCTDPTWKDPSCPMQCFNDAFPDIVYNVKTSLWACCTTFSNNTKLCQSPTDETWEAPAPADLVTVAVAASTSTAGGATLSSSSLTTTTASSTTASTTAATPTSALASSGGLSGGAKAGIGVGVAVGVLLLLALGFFFLVHRAKRARRREGGDTQWEYGTVSQVIELPGHSTLPPQEKLGVELPRELGTEATPELDAAPGVRSGLVGPSPDGG